MESKIYSEKEDKKTEIKFDQIEELLNPYVFTELTTIKIDQGKVVKDFSSIT